MGGRLEGSFGRGMEVGEDVGYAHHSMGIEGVAGAAAMERRWEM